MTAPLAGKKVIVAGTARGIGAAAVRGLIEAGAQVAALDIDPGGQAVIDAANRGAAGLGTFRLCDIVDRAQAFAAVDAAVAEMGGVDALIHIAGVQRYVPAESITDEEWDRLVGVNAKGVMITNQAVFPHFKAQGSGRIVNFASAAGARGLRGCAHYAASKGAVLAWTRTIAMEWGPLGISCNSVAPGIWTPMYDTTRSRLDPEALAAHDAAMARNIPLGGRLGDPDKDMAPVLVFLVSDGARFITGQTIPVDGGLLMVR